MLGRVSRSVALWIAGLHLAAFLGIWQVRRSLESAWGPSDFVAHPNWDWAGPLLGFADIFLGLPLFYPALALLGDSWPVLGLALVLNSVAWGLGGASVVGRWRSNLRAVEPAAVGRRRA